MSHKPGSNLNFDNTSLQNDLSIPDIGTVSIHMFVAKKHLDFIVMLVQEIPKQKLPRVKNRNASTQGNTWKYQS